MNSGGTIVLFFSSLDVLFSFHRCVHCLCLSSTGRLILSQLLCWLALDNPSPGSCFFSCFSSLLSPSSPTHLSVHCHKYDSQQASQQCLTPGTEFPTPGSVVFLNGTKEDFVLFSLSILQVYKSFTWIQWHFNKGCCVKQCPVQLTHSISMLCYWLKCFLFTVSDGVCPRDCTMWSD